MLIACFVEVEDENKPNQREWKGQTIKGHIYVYAYIHMCVYTHTQISIYVKQKRFLLFLQKLKIFI